MARNEKTSKRVGIGEMAGDQAGSPVNNVECYGNEYSS